MSGVGLSACEHACILHAPICLVYLPEALTGAFDWLLPRHGSKVFSVEHGSVCTCLTPPIPRSQLTFEMLVGGSGLQRKTYVSWILVLFSVVVMLKIICRVVKTFAGRSLVPG